MKSLVPTLCLPLLLTLTTSTQAAPGIPDLSNCYATSGAGCIMITPAGNGPTLASEDLTVTVVLLDAEGAPIPGYPFQDIWLHQEVPGDLAMCQGGSVADSNTNAQGETTIRGAMAGGGFTQSGIRVYVAGMPIGTEPLPIDVVSPDIVTDLVVNMADLGTFAADYLNGVYDFRSDLFCDGQEDLRDIAAFAVHIGEACP